MLAKDVLILFSVCWFTLPACKKDEVTPPSVTKRTQGIPNAGFEDWALGDPIGWATTNVPQDSFFNVTQSSESRTGRFAVQGIVNRRQGIAQRAELIAGFRIDGRPGPLHGWYKFTREGDNQIQIGLIFYEMGSSTQAAYLILREPTASYSEFVVRPEWIGTEDPDSVIIRIGVIRPTGIYYVGTTFWVDDLAFEPVSISKTVVEYANPQRSREKLSVVDVMGREVTTLVNDVQEAGVKSVEFDASGFASGVYLYRLQAGGFVETKKLLLLR